VLSQKAKPLSLGGDHGSVGFPAFVRFLHAGARRRFDRVSPLAISAETGSRDAVGLHCRENAVRSRHGNRKIAGTWFERYGRVWERPSQYFLAPSAE
jgi:hypothetical protein